MGAPARDTSDTKAPARERILRAARELFYERGVNAVGVDAVVARAGVAKMSLYNHFPSKDALVAAALRRIDDDWFGWFESAVARRADDPKGRLLASFDAFGEWFADPGFRGCAFINSAAEVRDENRQVRAITRAHAARLRALLAADARSAGAHDPDALAEQLLLLLNGATVAATIAPGPGAAQSARSAAEALLSAAFS